MNLKEFHTEDKLFQAKQILTLVKGWLSIQPRTTAKESVFLTGVSGRVVFENKKDGSENGWRSGISFQDLQREYL